MTIGYIRVSTDKQDSKKQHHLLLEYANQNKIVIDEFIEVEISSRKDSKQRRIDELLEKLKSGDTLIVAELSRLGRNMYETLDIINTLASNNVKIIFVRQPELSTNGPHTKLLLAIYSYFAEAERDFISMRTRQGLAAAKASGKTLGRPKGVKNKERALDKFKEQIKVYLQSDLSISSIRKLINPILDKNLSYNTYKYFIESDEELNKLRNEKQLEVDLYLSVENNSSHVRGKTRARENIERYVLSHYNMRKKGKNSWEYFLTIPYETDDDLEKTIYDILREAESEANTKNCFTEGSITALDGSERSW